THNSKAIAAQSPSSPPCSLKRSMKRQQSKQLKYSLAGGPFKQLIGPAQQQIIETLKKQSAHKAI
ncbi:hypothetical protein Dimus_007568, partial [Dionaea muscipula]